MGRHTGGQMHASGTVAPASRARILPHHHQANTHYYALPDQLHAMLDAAGFEVEATFGGFGGEAYDEDESDHLIFAARLRD